MVRLTRPLGSLSKPRRQRKRQQTKGLMNRTIAVHVRYKSLYISRPSTAEQQRKMTKFCALWRTWASTAMVSYFVLEFFAGSSYLSLSKSFRHRLVCWEGSDSYEGKL